MRLLIFAAAMLMAWPVTAETITAEIMSVHDGDTLTAQADGHGFVVRMNGLDAPELAQPGGHEATAWLKSTLPKGQTVRLETAEAPDRYGRIIATVFIGEIDVCRAEIAAGMAWYNFIYRRSLTELQRADYKGAELSAKAAGLGIWTTPQPLAPWAYRKSLRKL